MVRISWVDALQRVVLALDRDEDLARRHQGVQGEQPERGRAVEDHVVDARGRSGAGPATSSGAAPGPPAGTNSISAPARSMVAGTHLQVRGFRETVHDTSAIGVARAAPRRCRRPDPVLDAQRGAGVALRVEVDDQHPQTPPGEGGGDVDRGGGLADATLLVGHHDCPGGRGARQLRARFT